MKPTMKVVILGMVVALLAIAASATAVDPAVIVRDPVGCPTNNCVNITGLSFSFNVPQAGTGVLHFLNSSGVTWTSLILTEVGVAAVNVTCSSDVFSCAVMNFGQNGAKVVLSAINGFTGIPAGNSFEIILGCAKGDCPAWPGGLQFDVTANVPEPATTVLMLTGLGALYTRRKRARQLA